ncbi:helix-turn-helix domain-containing protein [Streptomyces microflavus]|uniref:helix-turn-helix domain-containing protein n=1 Tax=Streptomyces microflavus TaxID=1919 RepID=UPI0033E32625
MAQEQQLLQLARVRAAVNSGEARRLREASDLSIGEVARACGVDQSTVWRWERGARKPRGGGALAYGELIDSLRNELHPSTSTHDFGRTSGNSNAAAAVTATAPSEPTNPTT